MASERWTPGPWRAGRPDMATIVDGFDSKWIYAGNKYVAVASGQDVENWEEVMSNAHLIAAAPELYEALKKCVAYLEPFDSEEPIRCLIGACAALAKARGEAPDGKD